MTPTSLRALNLNFDLIKILTKFPYYQINQSEIFTKVEQLLPLSFFKYFDSIVRSVEKDKSTSGRSPRGYLSELTLKFQFSFFDVNSQTWQDEAW